MVFLRRGWDLRIGFGDLSFGRRLGRSIELVARRLIEQRLAVAHPIGMHLAGVGVPRVSIGFTTAIARGFSAAFAFALAAAFGLLHRSLVLEPGKQVLPVAFRLAAAGLLARGATLVAFRAVAALFLAKAVPQVIAARFGVFAATADKALAWPRFVGWHRLDAFAKVIRGVYIVANRSGENPAGSAGAGTDRPSVR